MNKYVCNTKSNYKIKIYHVQGQLDEWARVMGN